MRMQSSSKRLLGTSSVLALSAAAFLASSGTPASAQATQALYFGGSTLASEAFRQIFDCYAGKTVGTAAYTDGYNFDATFPGPGKLPVTCTSPTQAASVMGLYSGVGSGNGVRGFIANNPQQWYGGTVTPNASSNILIATPLPATKPPLIDYANPGSPVTKFGSYPYPRVDVGLSDSPLPGTIASLTTVSFSFNPTQSWSTTGGALAQITLNSTTATPAYTTSIYGQPIQIPAFEVNVAIPVNVNSASFSINSQIKSGGNIVQGGAIQLTEGQLCAVFSGLVTNWNSSTTITYLDSAGVKQTAPFYYANVGNGIGTAAPYATASLPIKVVFRSDGSGTSFILTNYLKAVCPLLDTGTVASGGNGYAQIFGAANLPNTAFANLVTNIGAARGAGPWTPGSTVAGAWLGAAQSSGVQAGVNDTAGSAGAIGYLSGDYVKPYAIVTTAPHAAALQNENLRINGINVPNTVSTSALTFIAPTPASADAAWNDTRLQVPSTTWTYADYNIYNNNFATPVVQGGVTVSGRSVLPLTNVVGAYPLSGTAFLDLYSCYNTQSDANRVTNLRNFLTWYINGASNAQLVVENNGFHLLPPAYSTNIVTQYLTSTQSGFIKAAATLNNQGCTGVTGGATGGAK